MSKSKQSTHVDKLPTFKVGDNVVTTYPLRTPRRVTGQVKEVIIADHEPRILVELTSGDVVYRRRRDLELWP